MTLTDLIKMADQRIADHMQSLGFSLDQKDQYEMWVTLLEEPSVVEEWIDNHRPFRTSEDQEQYMDEEGQEFEWTAEDQHRMDILLSGPVMGVMLEGVQNEPRN